MLLFVVDQCCCCCCCFLVEDEGIVGVITSAVVGVLDADEDDKVECVGTVVVFVCFFVVVGVVLPYLSMITVF